MAIISNIDSVNIQNNTNPERDTAVRRTDTGALAARVAEGTRNVNDALLSLVKGQTLRGEVTDLQNDSVKILLSNGKTLSATLKNISTLSIGDNAQFRVVSATASNVSLKLEGNPVRNTLLSTINRALTAAGLAMTERNSEAVRELLTAGLAIKREAIFQILAASNDHPSASFQTLARLMQMELPLTNENVNLMERYNNNELSLRDAVADLTGRVTEALTGAPDAALRGELVDLLRNFGTVQNDNVPAQTGVAQPPENNGSVGNAPLSSYADDAQISALRNTLSGILGTDAGISADTSLNDILAGLVRGGPEPEEAAALNGVGQGQNETTSSNIITSETLAGNAGFAELSATPEFAAVISSALTKHWSLSPTELMNGPGGPEELTGLVQAESENVNRILRSFEDSVGRQTAGKEESGAAVRNSIDFAGLVNEIYPYIQIPVELRGSTVHSELFVYAKKKGGPLNREDRISVMLHLDMDALGPLDVRVEMDRSNINAKFFVNDEISERLINENIGMLDKALADKGYIFTGEVNAVEKGRNPLEDFLVGYDPKQLKRFSLDVRA